MEDAQIVELYWARAETAISETERKYGGYCRRIAHNILRDGRDSEECVNDAWLRAWDSIPPQRPASLKAYLGRIVRNLSLDRYDRLTAARRGLGQAPAALDELAECLPDGGGDAADEIALSDALNGFLRGLSPERRRIFLQRYWYFGTVREIAAGCGMGESKVKMSLLRTRNELRRYLEKEGITI